MIATPNIKTARCILRLPEEAEAIEMCRFICNNKEHLTPWEASHNADYYTEKFWQNRIIQIHNEFLEDKSCCLNLYEESTDELIGMVNVNNIIRGAFHSCFLGFKVAENKQRKGLMTEALSASISYVFDVLNIHRISANYMPRNIASAKILEKCGFIQEGFAEDYLYINGKWEDHVLTVLINKKWGFPHE